MSSTEGEPDSPGLEALLSRHGESYRMENGLWVKFEAWSVEPTEAIPHGIRYSLTLHERNNRRLLGYDNAHAVQGRRRRFQAKRTIWDHKHEGSGAEPYEFDSPATLLDDFWADVSRIMGDANRG